LQTFVPFPPEILDEISQIERFWSIHQFWLVKIVYTLKLVYTPKPFYLGTNKEHIIETTSFNKRIPIALVLVQIFSKEQGRETGI
jgi:hypothetical protein